MKKTANHSSFNDIAIFILRETMVLIDYVIVCLDWLADVWKDPIPNPDNACFELPRLVRGIDSDDPPAAILSSFKISSGFYLY